MHGVRKELIKKQAEAAGIPVTFLNLSENPSMEEYNTILEEQMVRLMEEGFTHAAFGDIFLEDLREYREKQLDRIGMKPLFPIWGEDTLQLARQFVDDGFKAIFVCVYEDRSISNFIGTLFSNQFLEQIPGDVDPCGENGEFHTFVYDGPVFSNPINVRKEAIVEKKYPSPDGEGEMNFTFCDLGFGEI